MKRIILYTTVSILYFTIWLWYNKEIESAHGGEALGAVIILLCLAILYTSFEIVFIFLVSKKCKIIELFIYILIYIACILPFAIQLIKW